MRNARWWLGGMAMLAALAGCSTRQAPDSLAARAPEAPAPLAAPDPEKKPYFAASVPELLKEMTSAVSAGDQPRYLACVLTTDPVFEMEQKNWAKDLSRTKPEAFEVRLSDPEAELKPRADGTIVAPITFTWRMPEAKERTLSFDAKFFRDKAGWHYAGEHWKVLEAPGTRVLFQEGLDDAAKIVADVMPEVREHVHGVFGLEGDEGFKARVQEVKLYRTMKHLQHSIYLSYSDGLGGWNEPGEAIKVLSSRRTTEGSMKVLLGHEYGHCATFHYGPKANDMPWWILEGVAEVAAEKYAGGGARADRTVQGWAKRGNLREWSQLADFHGEAAKHYSHVYTQGQGMVRYIAKRFGKEKRIAWMRAMSGEGALSLDEATKKVLGVSFEQLDKEWRKSLDEAGEEKKEAA